MCFKFCIIKVILLCPVYIIYISTIKKIVLNAMNNDVQLLYGHSCQQNTVYDLSGRTGNRTWTVRSESERSPH